jgi:hypothetical protein
MDWKFNRLEKYVIVFACAMIIILGLTGCATNSKNVPTTPTEVPTNTETVKEALKMPENESVETLGNMPVIVDALGCIFAPQTCGENTDK